MIIAAKNLEELDFSALMDIYAEGNEENALKFWPEKSPEERNVLALEAYFEYLRDGFFSESKGTYYIFEEAGVYMAALRLEHYGDGVLLEALETRPDARKKGFATKLIKEVQTRMPRGTRIYSHVSKSNAASIAVHTACDFEMVCDWVICDDGEKDYRQLTFLYIA